MFGITVKELDINQVPLEEDWMASNMEDEEEGSKGSDEMFGEEKGQDI